jgi:hypothetical protein
MSSRQQLKRWLANPLFVLVVIPLLGVAYQRIIEQRDRYSIAIVGLLMLGLALPALREYRGSSRFLPRPCSSAIWPRSYTSGSIRRAHSGGPSFRA